MSFKDHFDAAFCINLDRRSDRWEASKKQCELIGIEVERVSAVNGFSEPPASIRPGEVGCLKSHLKVFEIAVERGLKSFLLLEDDIQFAENFNQRFNKIEPQIPSYEILYLGINPLTGSRYEISPNISRVMNGYAAHCVIFKESCYQDIISALKGPLIAPVDVHYGTQQVNHTAYVTRPHLAWQRQEFSDINQDYVDYEFLRG